MDRAPNVGALRAHGLHLAAARIWRSRGAAVPPDLVEEARRAEIIAMAAPVLLERALGAYEGQLLLMKGPEAAAWHPHPADRYFRDLDLLADDAPAAQQALVAAGFIELGDPARYDDAQHLRPLVWPGVPLVLELHRHPNRPAWLPTPEVREIVGSCVTSATGVPGLLAPDPSAHVLLLVAHSWAHQPLGRLVDLLDVAALMRACDPRRVSELARRWGWDGAWRVAAAATEAVFEQGGRSRTVSVWARHLSSTRERTVLENHLARFAAPASALPPARVPRAVAGVLRSTATRRRDESWAGKLRRSRLAAAHALMEKSTHERTLPPRAAS